jgi:hypothetical protein
MQEEVIYWFQNIQMETCDLDAVQTFRQHVAKTWTKFQKEMLQVLTCMDVK